MKKKPTHQTQRQTLSADERSVQEVPEINTFAPAGIITDADVARRAYEEFESSGCQHGHDVEHWLNAESRIAAERTF